MGNSNGAEEDRQYVVKAERPKVVPSMTMKIETGCGNMYVTIGVVDSEPFEIYATLGKAGGCMHANLEAVTRCISVGLRCGVDPKEYVNELKDIQCPSAIPAPRKKRVMSCADAIAQVLSGEAWIKEVNDD